MRQWREEEFVQNAENEARMMQRVCHVVAEGETWYRDQAEKLCEAAADANRKDIEEVRCEMANESARKTHELVEAINAHYAENRQQLVEYYSSQLKNRDDTLELYEHSQNIMRTEVMELANDRNRQTRALWDNASEVIGL